MDELDEKIGISRKQLDDSFIQLLKELSSYKYKADRTTSKRVIKKAGIKRGRKMKNLTLKDNTQGLIIEFNNFYELIEYCKRRLKYG